MQETSIMAGMVLEEMQMVTPERTAPHLGSGSLLVYATPAMGMFVEQTCHKLLEPLLPDGKTTVGIEINLRHLAPTPAGKRVYVRVEITAVDGALITFEAHLRDDFEQIGDAMHRRAIVDIERFLKRVEAKMKPGD